MESQPIIFDSSQGQFLKLDFAFDRILVSCYVVITVTIQLTEVLNSGKFLSHTGVTFQIHRTDFTYS